MYIKEGVNLLLVTVNGRELKKGCPGDGVPSNTNGDKFSLSPFHCMIPIATIQCQGTVIGWLVRQSLADPPSEP